MNAAANPPNGWITLTMLGINMASPREQMNQTMASTRSLVCCQLSSVSSVAMLLANNPSTRELSNADLKTQHYWI